MKNFTIPIFIPELACPFQCLYCNQQKISGNTDIPKPEEVSKLIDQYLETIPSKDSHIEIGFFGGNFTGIPCSDQQSYLELAKPYLDSNRVQGLRLSTRPDYIDEERLKLLKDHGVTTIELGAQSMDDEVLRKSGRGHLSESVVEASNLIKQYGMDLGLQMMIGLPGDTKEKALNTAKQIIELGASNTRIYPTLVIRNTQLELNFKEGKYDPLSLEEAVDWTSDILPLFEEAKVKILRVGLHPSEGLIDGDDLIAGPFHPSFKELVLSKLWQKQFQSLEKKSDSIEIFVHPKQLNYAVGYESSNKKELLHRFKKLNFKHDESLENRSFYVNYR